MKTELNNAAVYVSTYKKYNEGSIEGKWLTLSDYSDYEEFYEACKELHKDETDAEYMFQDWECISNSLIGESWISENFWKLKDEIENNSINEDAFFAWINLKSIDIDTDDISDLIRQFEDAYRGEYNSKEEFAEELMNECYEIPPYLENYIDYSAFARDLFMTDYDFNNGFVFSSY